MTIAGGDAGDVYVIKGSEDLLTWTVISTNAAGLDGNVYFSDDLPAGAGQRFYRAELIR